MKISTILATMMFAAFGLSVVPGVKTGKLEPADVQTARGAGGGIDGTGRTMPKTETEKLPLIDMARSGGGIGGTG